MADIGGGSTELVLGSPSTGVVSAAYSMDIGCVRMTERHLRADPPSAEQIAATVADVRAALSVAAQQVPGIRILPVPFDVTPIVNALWWHPVHNRDPEHAWMRSMFTEAARVVDTQLHPAGSLSA